MAQEFCRRCVIPDFIKDKDSFISAYLSRILPEERAEDAVYDDRLKKCSECESYINGICRLCGCFVALRAAHKGQYCPAHSDKWQEGQ